MDLDHFIVKWIDENPIRFSVMSRNDIAAEEKRRDGGEVLKGEVIFWKWKTQQCRGEIVEYGSKSAMLIQMKCLVKSSADDKPKRTRKPNESTSNSVIAKKTRIDTTLQAIPVMVETDSKDIKIRDLQDQLAAEISKRQELEEKYISIKNQLEERPDVSSDVDIGNGILVKQQTLSAIRTVSGSMNIYARNLFRTMFGVDEVVGRSLTGKGCNANKHSPKQASVDPARRDAIIEHSLKLFGKTPGTEFYRLGVKDLKKSLSCLIQEMSTEANRLEADLTPAPPTEN